MADGTITLKAESDDKGVKVGMRDIEASVKRMLRLPYKSSWILFQN